MKLAKITTWGILNILTSSLSYLGEKNHFVLESFLVVVEKRKRKNKEDAHLIKLPL